jgi:hypothetical protein
MLTLGLVADGGEWMHCRGLKQLWMGGRMGVRLRSGHTITVITADAAQSPRIAVEAWGQTME